MKPQFLHTNNDMKMKLIDNGIKNLTMNFTQEVKDRNDKT